MLFRYFQLALLTVGDIACSTYSDGVVGPQRLAKREF